jgi:hypothetical protein
MERAPMSPTDPATIAAWPLKRRCETIARFWGLHWSAIQLTILRDKGEADLAAFKYAILRRHQRSHFLPGLDKLGIDRALPPAVIAGRYHFLSNAIGGLAMEYVEESPRKVWIRYLPPAWSFPGQSLFAVPASVERAMFAGWHPFNGRSLGTRRLGFVVTKVYQQGEPYDEGYFQEHDRDLDDDECLRFEPVTISPDYDPEAAPRLDPAAWPEDRLVKAKRNFAIGYVEDAIQTALEMYGVHGAAALIGHAARLVAIQFTAEFMATFGIEGNKAADLAALLEALSALAGENFTASHARTGIAITRTSRVLAHAPAAPEIYAALSAFIPMAAKVMSPRIRVTRVADGPQEEWLIADTGQRLF